MRGVALVVAAAGCVLAGCSSPAPAAPQPFGVPTSAPTASAPSAEITYSPAQEEMFGPRVKLDNGLLLKQVGKVAEWGGPDDSDPETWTVRMIVDKIEVDPKCGPYISKPERGHRLVLSLRVETSKDYTSADGTPQYYQWSTIGQDGVSEAAPSSSQDCRSGKAFPSELRASAKYRGEVTVETANPSGQLVLSDFAAYNYPV